MTHFADQVRVRLISHLIISISRILQKFLKYEPDVRVLLVIFALNLKDPETVMLSFGSSL